MSPWRLARSLTLLCLTLIGAASFVPPTTAPLSLRHENLVRVTMTADGRGVGRGRGGGAGSGRGSLIENRAAALQRRQPRGVVEPRGRGVRGRGRGDSAGRGRGRGEYQQQGRGGYQPPAPSQAPDNGRVPDRMLTSLLTKSFNVQNLLGLFKLHGTYFNQVHVSAFWTTLGKHAKRNPRQLSYLQNQLVRNATLFERARVQTTRMIPELGHREICNVAHGERARGGDGTARCPAGASVMPPVCPSPLRRPYGCPVDARACRAGERGHKLGGGVGGAVDGARGVTRRAHAPP